MRGARGAREETLLSRDTQVNIRRLELIDILSEYRLFVSIISVPVLRLTLLKQLLRDFKEIRVKETRTLGW